MTRTIRGGSAFATINSAAHRCPDIVSRARHEVPEDTTSVFGVRSGGASSQRVSVPTYTNAQFERLAARVKELMNGQA